MTKVECGIAQVGGESLNKRAQGRFCLVHVTVKNIGNEARPFTSSNQSAHKAAGQKSEADGAAGIYLEDDSRAFLEDINPGNSVNGIVFDIPKDAQIAKLELHDSAFSGGVVVNVSRCVSGGRPPRGRPPRTSFVIAVLNIGPLMVPLSLGVSLKLIDWCHADRRQRCLPQGSRSHAIAVDSVVVSFAVSGSCSAAATVAVFVTVPTPSGRSRTVTTATPPLGTAPRAHSIRSAETEQVP